MSKKDKIAIFLATSGHSGVDRIAAHLVPELARRGYAVDLLKVDRHGPNLGPLPAGVREIRLGTRHVYSALPAIVGYLRREQPAVLFTDKDRVNRTALISTAVAGTRTRVVVGTGTTLSIELANRGWLDRRLQIWSVRYLYPRAYNVIVTSRGVADDMARYTGLERSRITPAQPPTIDPRRVEHARNSVPPHPWLESCEPPVVLGVGELSGRKDYAMLVRAFAALRKSRPCRLVILGEGDKRRELEELTHSLGITEYVDMPGFVADPYPYMAHAAVFAHASRWEGLGMVLVEALALGTPVVAADCPSGPREVLADGRYGTLVPVGDAPAMTEALARTLDAPPFPYHLRRAAEPFCAEPAVDNYLRAMGLPGDCDT